MIEQLSQPAGQGDWGTQWARLVARAWSDPVLKERLLADPVAVLKEHGMQVRPGLQVRVVADTGSSRHLILPARPGPEELSEEVLGSAAAGAYARCACACGACAGGRQRCDDGPPANPRPIPDDTEPKAIARIQQLGARVMEVAQNDNRLEVSYEPVGEKCTDKDLAPLGALTKLVELNLCGLNVTDAGLAHLKGLVTLTRLRLERTRITDRGLENLRGLTNLEYLNLYGTAVGDAGLVHLEGMKKLKHLYLWQTKVTDAGVARLQKALPQVEIVRGSAAADKPEGAKDGGPPKK